MDESTQKPKRKLLYRMNMVVFVILVFIIGMYVGRSQFVNSIVGGGPSFPNVSDAALYGEVWSLIHTDFFNKKVSDQSLFYASIKGMVSSLNDPVSLFFDPSDTSSFNNLDSGNTFAGIGVELGYKDNIVIVDRIVPSSPAASSTLKVGDEILDVNGTATSGQSLDTITNEIRGTAGSSVSLTIEAPGATTTNNVSIVRKSIHVAAMYVQTLTTSSGKKVDDLVVSRFTEDTLSDWESEWDQSVQTILADKPAGLIIDLRDNPGGYFNAGVYAIGDFVPKNTVAAMSEDRNGSKTRFYTQQSPRLTGLKTVLLVNANTASAAEIFSGGLQYYKKATVIGAPTYGKGTEQQIYTFSDGSSLHLTTMHWLLPSGRWIQKSDPIHPDSIVQYTNADYMNGVDPQLQAAETDF
jgi:carboxyl-terminal processing protease